MSSPGSAGQLVNNNAAIPFPITGNPNPSAPGTKISMSAAGSIEISDTGWYQLSWGFQSSSNPGKFQVQLNGVGVGLGPNTAQIDYAEDVTGSTGDRYMNSETILVHVTTNPSTIKVVNNSGSSITLNNGSETSAGGPIAYVTLIKISN